MCNKVKGNIFAIIAIYFIFVLGDVEMLLLQISCLYSPLGPYCPLVEFLKKHTLGWKGDENRTSSMLDLQGALCHMLAESVQLVLFITAVSSTLMYSNVKFIQRTIFILLCENPAVGS